MNHTKACPHDCPECSSGSQRKRIQEKWKNGLCLLCNNKRHQWTYTCLDCCSNSNKNGAWLSLSHKERLKLISYTDISF